MDHDGRVDENGGRHPARSAERWPRWAAVLVAGSVTAAGVTLAACSASPSAARSTTTTVATSRACQTVAAVLSDGPDPTADPVGYALAQVRPLRQLQTDNATLRVATVALAAAFTRFYAADGSSSTKAVLAKAEAAINRLCPGAAP